MQGSNICKFVTSNSGERLTTSNFIYETSPEIMQREERLPSHRLLLVSSGGGRLFADGNGFSAETGTLVFLFMGERVSFLPEAGTEYLYISFEGRRAEELFRRFLITSSHRCFHSFESLIPLWKDSLSRAEDRNLDLLAEGVLLLTLSRIADVSEKKESIASRMLRYVEENFTDPDCSLSLLSEKLGYNPKYLSHQFKNAVGSGFSDYLRTLRIKHAIFLMDHGVESVKNIAFLCGYTDPLYFSSVFKGQIGMSPKAYCDTKRLDRRETE